MFKSMFTRKEGNPKYMIFVSCIIRMIFRFLTFYKCIGEFEKNILIYYIDLFFAKVWSKFC